MHATDIECQLLKTGLLRTFYLAFSFSRLAPADQEQRRCDRDRTVRSHDHADEHGQRETVHAFAAENIEGQDGKKGGPRR